MSAACARAAWARRALWRSFFRPSPARRRFSRQMVALRIVAALVSAGCAWRFLHGAAEADAGAAAGAATAAAARAASAYRRAFPLLRVIPVVLVGSAASLRPRFLFGEARVELYVAYVP